MGKDKREFYEQMERPKAEALKRIREELYEEPRRPDEFTAKEAAIPLGISERAAMNRLKKIEEKGLLTSRMLGNSRLFRWLDS